MKQRVFLYSGDCSPLFHIYSDWVGSYNLRKSVVKMVQHYTEKPFVFSSCLKSKNAEYNSYAFRPSISDSDYQPFKSIKDSLRANVDGHIGSMSHGIAELALAVMCIYAQSSNADKTLLQTLFILHSINPALLNRGVFEDGLKDEWLSFEDFPNLPLIEVQDVSLKKLSPSKQLILRPNVSKSYIKPAWSLGGTML